MRSAASLLTVCLCAGLKGAALTRCYLRDTDTYDVHQHCVRGGSLPWGGTHQISAHGALCQHESAFRHQENLDVGKTRGLLLLVVILLRVVGAAPLGADLVFNLHPSGSGSGRLGRHETERVRSGGEHLVIMTSCTAERVRISCQ